MPDLADRAQAFQERLNAGAFGRQKKECAAESLEFCAECGEPIPEERRAAVPGCRRCRECQEYLEAGA